MVTYLLSLYPDLFLTTSDGTNISPVLSPLNFMAGAGSTNTYALMASCNPQKGYVNERSTSFAWFKYDTVAASISCLALTLIALLILCDKRAQTHPNKMIAYVCLCDAYTFCQFVVRYVVCGYGWSNYLNWLYAITV